MSLIQMSVAGAIMILAILIFRRLLVNRLPKRTFVLLWLMALSRLLIPFSIPSKASVYSAMMRVPERLPAGMNMPARELAQRVLPVAPSAENNPLAASAAPVAASQAINWPFVVYCAGAALVLIYLLVAYASLYRTFRRADELTEGFARDWIVGQAIHRNVRVYASPDVKTPMTYGFLRPRILLPTATVLDDGALPYVLTHEMEHIRTFDAPLKMLFAVGLVVHWFNPLVWVMYILLSRDVELACDERVIRRLGADARQSYASLLLNMQAGQGPLTPLVSGFSRHSLKERIYAIMKHKRITSLSVVAAMLLMAFVATGFATSAVPPSLVVSPAWHSISIIEETPAEPDPDAVHRLGQLLERYDPDMSIRQVYELILEVFPSDDAFRISSIFSIPYEYTNEAQRQFLVDVLQPSLMELELYQPYYDDYHRHRNDPSGRTLVLVNGDDTTDSYALAYGWLGFETLAANDISAAERAHRLDQYEQQMQEFFAGFDLETLLAQDPVALLNAERDRLMQVLSTPALRIRAINFECVLLYDGRDYRTLTTFLDNVDIPPIQVPIDATDATMIHANTYLGVSYGALDAQGIISPDGGGTWYKNDWRDPQTGIRHRYDPATDILCVSADDGRTWYEQVSYWNFYSGDHFNSLTFWDGNWAESDDLYSTPSDAPELMNLTQSIDDAS